MNKRNAYGNMKVTQSEVALHTFKAMDKAGKNFSPAARGQRESATFASSINGDRAYETKIPTGKNFSPAPLAKVETPIFAS